MKQRMRMLAFTGALAWSVTLFVRTSDAAETLLIERILLLGIFVIVPLGLSLIRTEVPKLNRIIELAIPIGATCAFVSLLLEPGPLAAVLVLPWLIATTIVGLIGLWRVRQPGLREPPEISISAALVYLPIGAVWLFAYGFGIQPMGFGDTIVLLTAIHFHFAGFAAPLLTGLTGRHLAPKTSLLLTIAVVGVISGTPLVAAGITASPAIALLGAIVITVGLLALSIACLVYAIPSIRSTTVRVLLFISSLAVLPAMALACAYAYSIVFNQVIIDIPQMAMTHGIANAFGFALCGLTAWTIVDGSSSNAE
jgi:hypothetical protein